MRRMKKIAVIFFTVLMSIVNVTGNMLAVSHNISERFLNGWTAHTVATEGLWGAATILSVDDHIAWCLEANKAAINGVNQEIDFSAIGIDFATEKRLSLIANFGYFTQPSETNYVLTQNLIWRELGFQSYYTNSEYPTLQSQQTWVNEVMNKVNNYSIYPSFHDLKQEITVGETLALEDTNGVLSQMQVVSDDGLKVWLEGNVLKVQATENTPDNAIISLKKAVVNEGVNFVVKSGNSQAVSVCYTRNPLMSQINFHVNKYGSLELTKANVHQDIIDGATFRVWNDDGYDQNHIVTNGKLLIEKLLPTDYYIQEIQAPEGYLINENVYTVTVQANEKITQVIENTEPTGQVILSKIDGESTKPQGDASFLNTEYTLYAKEDIYNKAKTVKYYSKDEVVSTCISNVNGEFEAISNIPLGKYYLKETSSPTGYLLDEKTYDITLSYKDQNTPIIINHKVLSDKVMKQAFSISKITSEGENGQQTPLANAEFTVKLLSEVNRVGWQQAKVYDVLKTDENGHATSIELPYGIYQVRETLTPENHYRVDDFYVTIHQDSREPQPWITLNDQPFKALVSIIKQDAETGKTIALEGATFKIKNLETGEYLGQWNWTPFPYYQDTFTTNELGQIFLPNLVKYGQYQLEEIKAPYGYLLNHEPVTFSVHKSGIYETAPDGITPMVTVIMKDTSVKGKITIEKQGEVLSGIHQDEKGDILFDYTKQPLVNAIFGIYAKENIYSTDNSKTLIYVQDSLIETITTDKDGKATSSPLPLGNYYVKEIQAPVGFILNPVSQDISLTYQNQDTACVFDSATMINERQKTKLSIIKKDKDNGTVLSGAVFGLFTKTEMKDAKGNILMAKDTLIEKVTSNEKGKATFKADLPLGEYYIKELQAPVGYSSSDEVIDIKVTYQGQDQAINEIEKIFENEITKINFSKTDITTGKSVIGAELSIYLSDENYQPILEKCVDTWITDETEHQIKGLQPNQTYVLKEVLKDVDELGYVTAQNVVFVVKDTGEIQKVEMKDDHTKVMINKIDTTTKVGIPNTILSIIPINEEGRLDLGATFLTAMTDENGQMAIEYIPIGKYVIRETTANFELGYVTADDMVIEVQDTDQIQYFTMTDDITKVEISKTDIATGKELAGATLQIQDKEGKIIEEWVTEDIPHYIEKLPVGDYILTEISAPYGYSIAKEVAFTVADTGKIQKVKMADEAILTDIQINKVDSITKELIKSGDFEFTLYKDANGIQMIETAKGDKETGTAIFKDIPYGTYYIKETKAPQGYELSSKMIKIVVDDHLENVGNTYSFIYENTPLPSKAVKTGDDTQAILPLLTSTMAVILFIFIRKEKRYF